jgi:sporulation protein YlmC with PRC-barrel domain
VNARQLKGMAVVSMADGTKIGNIQEILFDPAGLKVAALLMTMPGTESFLPFGSIRNIGADAITVESATAAEGAPMQSTLQGLRGLDNLIGLSVVSGEGTLLGQLHDITIDPADGRIAELTARSGGVLGIGATDSTVPGRNIRGIGANIITVETPAQGQSTPVA